METLGDIILPKICHKFYCAFCDYGTSKKSSFVNHIASAKHKNTIAGNDFGILGNQIMPKICSLIYPCSFCYKEFKNRSGLWKHKQKCNNNNNNSDKISDQKETEAKELIQYLLKENSEFKQLMIDQNKQLFELAKNSGHHNSHNTNNNTTNNNNFNLNVFLNETCKDAMNIMEFVDQLQVSVKDLEETGRLGYSEGISKIFINGLKQINISDRPIHCSDSKREIVYIKDKNEWTKEDDNKSLLTNAIKHVAHKNMRQIKEWTKVNPEYNDSSSKQNDRYLKIVSNSMNGSTEEETNKNYNKIIKNITKETIIDK